MYENMTVEIIDIVLRVGLTLATGFLLGIMFLSYWRTRTRKMLFITAGFAVFFIHALVTIPELFSSGYQINENLHLLIHLIGLALITIGVLKD
jgi:peptidoglycan/LPS O-acetylase OafA/YrhL